MFSLALHADPYPQRRDDEALSWLDRGAERLRLRVTAGWRLRDAQRRRFVDAVLAAQASLESLGDQQRIGELMQLRRELARHGLDRMDLLARAFALVRLESRRLLGLEHFPSQIQGAYVMLLGHVAEMQTGEGKSLTATLAAASAALAGMKVHVVTVNDYLAERDQQHFAPLYEALGLSCARVGEQSGQAEKSAAYGADIVYCNNKTVVFDYLRDRIALGPRMQPLRMLLDRLAGRHGASLMRGLQFAIVDEADSIFVDEARTPLIVSVQRPAGETENFLREAVLLARELRAGDDYSADADFRRIGLTPAGRASLPARLSSRPLSPVWRSPLRAEEILLLALQALHGFVRDVHYIVRDDKVQIVDENTGRVMPDRSWERGLHQLIEIKEGLAPTPDKETLGRISYQLFFRRYLLLSGMSGTLREVGSELAEVYGLGVVRIAPHKRSRRLRLPSRLYADADSRWQAVMARVCECRAKGQPVLVGTRSVAASETLSSRLSEAGIEHQLLNAKQDHVEATLIAAAGDVGRVTIATNMAGRGTDIQLSDAARAAGGLHVILTERHESSRIDRQLAGRCARMGEPGSWEELLSLDDGLIADALPALRSRVQRGLLRSGPRGFWHRAGLMFYRWAQWRLERRHARMRTYLLAADYRSRKALSFTGEME